MMIARSIAVNPCSLDPAYVWLHRLDSRSEGWLEYFSFLLAYCLGGTAWLLRSMTAMDMTVAKRTGTNNLCTTIAQKQQWDKHAVFR